MQEREAWVYIPTGKLVPWAHPRNIFLSCYPLSLACDTVCAGLLLAPTALQAIKNRWRKEKRNSRCFLLHVAFHFVTYYNVTRGYSLRVWFFSCFGQNSRVSILVWFLHSSLQLNWNVLEEATFWLFSIRPSTKGHQTLRLEQLCETQRS